MRRLLHTCVLISLVGLLPVSLTAQVSPGALTGTVYDPSQAPLPRATVRLVEAGREVARTLTDTQGRFRFEDLAAGRYTVEVSLTGFKTASAEAVPGTEAELVLEVAPVREQVVVTATRTEAPTSQVGSSVTVIAAEQLEGRQSVTLTELLRTVPGLAAVQSGPPGAITSIFVRGGESDHNKVFIDGVPVNEPGGFFNFANLTPFNVTRVEVVRGPQSALFGSDALGSTIQLFTERGRAETLRPRLRVAAEGGKHDTLRASAGLSGQFSRFDYALAAARLLSDNGAANSAFRNTSLAANFGLEVSERTSLRLVLHGDFGTVGTPGPVAFLPLDTGEFSRRRDRVVQVSVQDETSRAWRQRLAYGYARSRQRSVDEVDDTLPGLFDFLSDFLNDTWRHRLTYQSDYSFAPTQILTVAFEYEREQGRIGDFTFPPFVVAHRTNRGGVIQQQALFGPLALAGGVRIEDNGSFGTKATPRVSAAYFLRRAALNGSRLGATKLKFNFGTGIKEPQFVESFSPSPFFCGNPNLEPERVRSFDAGVEQRFARDRAKLEVNWFDNRFRDLVAFGVGDPEPADALACFASFFNIGRSKAKGSEVVLETSPWGGFQLTANYTFVNSQVVGTAPSLASDPVFGVGRPLLRRPRHAGALVVVWDWGQRLSVTSSLVFVGRRVDSDFLFPPLGLTRNASYTKWDLVATYRSRHKLTYFAVFENLLNRSYMEVLGFPALKFTVRAGARAEF